MNRITFKKAAVEHEKMIFSWLSEPHMMEYWDNSQEHKEDILNFIYCRKQHYFAGTTKYFIGSVDNIPFGFLLADIIEYSEELPDPQKDHMSKDGHTIAIDFGIGNKNYLGKSLAAITLEKFIEYYQRQEDPLADTFFIDPNEKNLRAKHVYEKAGFKYVDKYQPDKGAFIGATNLLMVKTSIFQSYYN